MNPTGDTEAPRAPAEDVVQPQGGEEKLKAAIERGKMQRAAEDTARETQQIVDQMVEGGLLAGQPPKVPSGKEYNAILNLSGEVAPAPRVVPVLARAESGVQPGTVASQEEPQPGTASATGETEVTVEPEEEPRAGVESGIAPAPTGVPTAGGEASAEGGEPPPEGSIAGREHPAATPATAPAAPTLHVAPPAMQVAPVNEVEERINADTSPQGVKRRNKYDTARQTADKLKQEIAAGNLPPEKQRELQKELQTAEIAVKRIDRDVENEIEMEKAAKEPDAAERDRKQKEIRERQIAAWTEDSLEDNEEYQRERKTFDADPAYKNGKAIDEMVHPQQQPNEKPEEWQKRVEGEQIAQDAAINSLSPKERKEYEQYVVQRERLRVTRQEAEFAAREQLAEQHERDIAKLPTEQQGAARESVKKERAALEHDRRRAAVDAMLAVDPEYQGLQRKYRASENALRKIYQGTPAEVEEAIRKLAGQTWAQLTPAERDAFAEGFRNQKEAEDAFNKDYSFDRGVMNGKEQHATNIVDVSRIKQGVDADGAAIPQDQIAAKVQEHYMASHKDKDKRQGPSAVRKGFKWLARRVDAWFGKAQMEEHRREAVGYAKDIMSDYGWRGMIAQWALPEKERATAKVLRTQMIKELGEYFRRYGIRKLGQLFLLSIVFWLVMPVIMGKGLDMVKPFGGNA